MTSVLGLCSKTERDGKRGREGEGGKHRKVWEIVKGREGERREGEGGRGEGEWGGDEGGEGKEGHFGKMRTMDDSPCSALQ